MEINREELLKILTSVRPGLASSEIMQQSTSFIFRDKKVSTYNDRLLKSLT